LSLTEGRDIGDAVPRTAAHALSGTTCPRGSRPVAHRDPPGARVERSDPDSRLAARNRWSLPTAVSEGTGEAPPWHRIAVALLDERSDASGGRQVGRRRPPSGERSRRRALRQLHV